MEKIIKTYEQITLSKDEQNTLRKAMEIIDELVSEGIENYDEIYYNDLMSDCDEQCDFFEITANTLAFFSQNTIFTKNGNDYD